MVAMGELTGARHRARGRVSAAIRRLVAVWHGFPRTMRAGIAVVWVGFLADTVMPAGTWVNDIPPAIFMLIHVVLFMWAPVSPRWRSNVVPGFSATASASTLARRSAT